MSRAINRRTTVKTRYFWTPCSIITLACTCSIVLATVIAGICVNFLVEEPLSTYILIGLTVFLLIVGIVGVVILELHRRQSSIKNESRGIVEQRYDFANATAPPYSHRSTALAGTVLK